MALRSDEQSVDQTEPDELGQESPPSEKASRAGQKKREIKGGLPYATAPGTLKRALDGIIVAARPEKFSTEFMSSMLKILGGSQRPIPPMLRKMGFITTDGSPTELYSKFKSDTARGQAALDGLRNAYSEIFRRNEHAQRATEPEIKDIIIEITGLQKSDQIVKMISQSFETIRSFADKSAAPSLDAPTVSYPEDAQSPNGSVNYGGGSGLGLSYHINIVLPQTDNIAVFNAIFRSLRENLL